MPQDIMRLAIIEMNDKEKIISVNYENQPVGYFLLSIILHYKSKEKIRKIKLFQHFNCRIRIRMYKLIDLLVGWPSIGRRMCTHAHVYDIHMCNSRIEF